MRDFYCVAGRCDYVEAQLRNLLERLMPVLDDVNRRAVLGAAAESIGRGGTTEVSDLTGLQYSYVRSAREQMRTIAPNAQGRGEQAEAVEPPRMGRRPSSVKFPGIQKGLLSLMANSPEIEADTPLSWTTLSTRQLAAKLEEKTGIRVGYVTVVRLLEEMGFRMQMRTRYGGDMDTDARKEQFEWVTSLARYFLSRNEPVLTTDLIRRNQGMIPLYPTQTYKSDDFSTVMSREEMGEILDYLEMWWDNMGSVRFQTAEKVLLVLDGVGWESERAYCTERLQELARKMERDLWVSLLPPGTTRWNRVEQQLTKRVEQIWENGSTRTIDISIRLVGKRGTGVEGEAEDQAPCPEPVPDEYTWSRGWNQIISCNAAGDNG